MAKEELFRWPLISYFLRKLGGFPVHRGRIDLEAMRQAYRELASGGILVMFPEGQRSRTGGLRVAFRGAAQIAVHANVPILPVAISGTEALDRFGGWFRRPKVVVNIGKPFYLPAGDGAVSREESSKFTDKIMSAVAALLPVTYRGEYGR
jgi:1-acyl-sn-glycerol-3-phosphate acyltransferase